MFGNAIDLDRGIFLDPENMDATTKAIHLSAWIAKMLRAQTDVINIAQATQAKHQAEYFGRFHITLTEFPEGSYVLKKLWMMADLIASYTRIRKVHTK